MPRNSKLAALQRELIGLVGELSRAQARSNKPESIIALSREIAEVTHRATLVGQLLFAEQTAALELALAKVRAGKAQLDAALDGIEDLNTFLKAISRFLGLVDKAIDIAKLI